MDDAPLSALAVAQRRIILTSNVRDFRPLLRENSPGVIGIPETWSVARLDSKLTALLTRHGLLPGSGPSPSGRGGETGGVRVRRRPVPHRHTQRSGDPADRVQARVPPPVLDLVDIGVIQPRPVGQLLLGQASRYVPPASSSPAAY